MQYRTFGRLSWKPSALGFGTMRLPLNSDNQADINEAEAIKLIRYAIDQGVNYIDSAYVYHEGNSEVIVGKALQDGYRDKVKIATKMPVFSVQAREDLDRVFDLQLKRLQTDRIDFYLLHALMKTTWQKAKELDMLEWAEQQIKRDRIGYLGFSFHDDFEVFKEIVDSYNWTFCQIQYNYLDEKYQAGREGLHYAASKGLAVVVMEPLAGGLLAVNPPEKIAAEWEKATVKRSPAEWALSWVWNQPEVSLALSGMNSIQQVTENLQIAERSASNTLSAQELEILRKSGEHFLECGYVGCTKCRYCSKCPQSIDIPVNLAFLNEYSAKRREPQMQDKIKQQFKQTIPEEQWANNCIHCGQCESVCPQHLPVRKLLSEASASLA